MNLEFIEFSLERILRDTLKSLAIRAHQKHLELLLNLAPNLPDRVFGDPGRLRQVIVNLVGNAVKFTDAGEIEVSIEKVSEEAGSEPRLAFSVRDTGIGIPHDKFERIFESFAQEDSSTTRKYGGTGLGLTISAQLVELMGGHIQLESELGKGSRFHFTLPMDAIGENSLLTTQDASKVAGMRVLVVDDNTRSLELLKDLLVSLKLRPTSANCAEHALIEIEQAQLAGQPYQLALVDAQMPDMDGINLASQFRHKMARMPIIMLLTSCDTGNAIARCREAELAHYLIKPVSPSDLLDGIVNTLGAPSPGALPALSHRSNTQSLNLLLAEDNAVNQKLAIRLLEKMGHHLTVANNGAEAVQLWRLNTFDAILMDVDMPELNGYEATRLIRAEETDSRHTPIIAMTAHAMQGAREECLRHGMDGYLSKPINTDELWLQLESILPSLPAPGPAQPATISPSTPVFDLGIGLETVGGDMGLFREMVDIYLSEYPDYLDGLDRAVHQKDVDNIRHYAHSLKGMLAIFGIPALVSLAQRIEISGQSNVEADYAELRRGLAWLKGELGRFRNE